jgi:photosystem II stability/assembly factor-like uncharacterized protein
VGIPVPVGSARDDSIEGVAPPPGTGEVILTSVQFADDGRRGWGVGSRGSILATENAGETWQTQASGTRQDLWSVHVTADGRRGWAVGDNGRIIRLGPAG